MAYREGRCIGATPIYKVYVNDIMDLNILYPKYRDQVMSKDPNKNLRINIKPTEKLTVDFALKGDKIRLHLCSGAGDLGEIFQLNTVKEGDFKKNIQPTPML